MQKRQYMIHNGIFNSFVLSSINGTSMFTNWKNAYFNFQLGFFFKSDWRFLLQKNNVEIIRI